MRRSRGFEPQKDYPVRPTPFTDVRLDDAFWSPRIQVNDQVTIPLALNKCQETGRIDNFARAGGLTQGPFRGFPFDDSDVFKIIEGGAYSLSSRPDDALETYLDDVINKIIAAQEDDGYLYTARTLDPPELASWIGDDRWSNL
jgi:DUF1680 family protein